MSSLMNKVKEALHSDKSEKHSSKDSHAKDSQHAKKNEPRSEADRDQREAYDRRQNEPYSSNDNYAHSGGGGGGGGAYDDPQAANRGARGPASRTDGPHSSDMANKMDPRVDSDRDYSKNMGMNPDRSATTGGGGGGYQAGHPGGQQYSRSSGEYGGAGTDPRHVPDYEESSRYEPGAGGRGTTGYGGAGGHGTGTGTQGAGYGRDTQGAGGYGHEGAYGDTRQPGSTGPAPKTAGPHKSDMMNKLDPRVDSDLDGSKTMGGDKTRARRD